MEVKTTPMADEPFDPAAVTHGLAQSIAAVGAMLAPLEEATAGYRDRLVSLGWSKPVAEGMALSYHRLLVHLLTEGKI